MKEMFGAVALGLLLLIIGTSTGTEWVYRVGSFVLPLALLWGGLFKSEESLPVKVTLLAIGGLALVSILQGFGGVSISSMFGF